MAFLHAHRRLLLSILAPMPPQGHRPYERQRTFMDASATNTNYKQVSITSRLSSAWWVFNVRAQLKRDLANDSGLEAFGARRLDLASDCEEDSDGEEIQLCHVTRTVRVFEYGQPLDLYCVRLCDIF